MPTASSRWPIRLTVASTYAALTFGVWFLLLAESHAATEFNDLAGGGLLLVVGTVGALVLLIVTRKRRGVHIGIVGLLLLALISATAFDVPMRTRWNLSEGAFDKLVAAHPIGSGDIVAPLRVGHFDIENVDASTDGYLFYDAAGDLSDTGDGIAYLPFGDRGAFPSQDEFVHLDGPWYRWIGYS